MALTMRYGAAIALLSGLVLGAQGATAEEPTTLTVYSTLTFEVFSKYQAAFEAENPDIKISHVHDSGGVVMARRWPNATIRRRT